MPYEASDQRQFIRCSVAAETYCLDLSLVQSIERSELLQWNKEGIDPIGWLIARPEAIPVYSLAIQLRHANLSPGPMLVFHNLGQRWALMVDRLLGIVSVTEEAIYPLPEIVGKQAKNFFKGVVGLGEELSLYLDPQRFYPTSTTAIAPTAPKPCREAETPLPARDMQSGKGQIFTFGVNGSRGRGLRFGLSVTQVLEVLSPVPMITVPGAADYVIGLINWRNRPVPIIDLQLCFGLSTTATSEIAQFLITRRENGELVGFPIQAGSKIYQLPLTHKPLISHDIAHKELTKGVFELNGEVLIIPNVNQVTAMAVNY